LSTDVSEVRAAHSSLMIDGARTSETSVDTSLFPFLSMYDMFYLFVVYLTALFSVTKTV
jgi:hypothetical protein